MSAGFIGAKDDRRVVTTGAIRHIKLQSNHHHKQTNTQFFTSRMPFLLTSQIITTNKPTPNSLQAGCSSCRPTNSVKVLKGR